MAIDKMHMSVTMRAAKALQRTMHQQGILVQNNLRRLRNSGARQAVWHTKVSKEKRKNTVGVTNNLCWVWVVHWWDESPHGVLSCCSVRASWLLPAGPPRPQDHGRSRSMSSAAPGKRPGPCSSATRRAPSCQRQRWRSKRETLTCR